jgi:hypothetical protein
MKKWITFALVASCFSGHLFAQNEVVEQPDVQPITIIDAAPTIIDEDLIIETKSDPNEVYLEEDIFEEIDFGYYDEFEDYNVVISGEADLSQLTNGRILKEINDTEGTDAYPFLSKDGLRLYWTQSEGGDHLVVASRTDVNSDFGAPKNLEMDFPTGGVMSCWLSEDELTIYFKDAGVLTRASRSALDAPFSNPEKIQLNFRSVEDPEYIGFFSAPSLTQDENQLFLYHSNDGQRIVQFERTANNEYTEVAVLEIEGEAEPGQLSHDGLSYSMTIKGMHKLFIFKRENLDQTFENKEEIDLGGSFHQITHNEDLMILGHSPDDSWSTNELYIAKYPLAKEEMVEEEVVAPQVNKETPSTLALAITDLELFPNPAEQYVNLRFELPEGVENAQIDILDLQGKLIRSQQINQLAETTLQLEVQDLVSGTYICRLSAKGLQTISKPLVIK